MMKKKTLLGLFLLLVMQVWAQTPEDREAFAAIKWNNISNPGGITCKQASCRLFGSDQHITWLEFSPDKFRLELSQPAKRTKPARQGKAEGALAAINGGFFQTKTNDAVANDFLKIADSIYISAGGWGDAALAIDKEGRLHFTPWNASSQESMDWQQSYPNVMVVGPLLVLDGTVLIGKSDEKRHPRTIAGAKPDGTIVLAVIDGRRKGMDGMASWESARLAALLGLESCINLDGGGSSSLWLKDKGTVSKPSDQALFFHKPRKVANFLLVYPR